MGIVHIVVDLTRGPTLNSIITGLVHSRPLSLTLVLSAPHSALNVTKETLPTSDGSIQSCYLDPGRICWMMIWIKHTTLSQIWHTNIFSFPFPTHNEMLGKGEIGERKGKQESRHLCCVSPLSHDSYAVLFWCQHLDLIIKNTTHLFCSNQQPCPGIKLYPHCHLLV